VIAPRTAFAVRDPVHHVLGDDDRRIYEQADCDCEPAERHRVEADLAALE
jgi:hypothetical protein